MSLRVLVEYCTKDRSEQKSFTLRGTETSYLDHFKQLATLVNIQIPYVSIEENTEELFEAIRNSESLQAPHSDVEIGRLLHARMPRIGAFEVYLKMEVLVSEGPSQCRAERLKLVSSKIQGKRWTKVSKIVELLLQTIENETQEFVLRSLDSSRNYYAHQIFYSSLGASLRPRDTAFCVRCRPKECRCPVGAFGETWLFSGSRELTFLPTEFLRVGDWESLRRTVCNLHFVAAKIRICGLRALQEDLELALNLTGQPITSKTTKLVSPKTAQNVPSALSTGSLAPSRQTAYEFAAYAQFLERNAETLRKKPSQIYVLASRMPLPGLESLKKAFLGGLRDLHNLSIKIDVEDRECTPEELLKFVTGLANISWSASVSFVDVFSSVEKRWISEVEMGFRARVVIQQEACLALLRQDGRKCRTMLEVMRNGTMRDVSTEGRFIMLSQLLSEVRKKMTLRLALDIEGNLELTTEQGFKIVDSVFQEFKSLTPTTKVDAALKREQQKVQILDDSHLSYFVTVEFSALPVHAMALEKTFDSFVDALTNETLASCLPNRHTLRLAGEGHDVDVLILLRLPNSLAMEDDEFKLGVLDDIRCSSFLENADEVFSLEQVSRKQLLVRVHADLLPEGTTPESVAKDLMQQLNTPSSALISDDRKVLLHAIWMGFVKGGSPLRLPGLSGRVCLRASGIPEASDQPQIQAFSQHILPALITTCRTKGLILSLLCDTARVKAGPVELCAKLIPDRSIAGAASGVNVVLSNIVPEDQSDCEEKSEPLSAVEKRKRRDAQAFEVDAVAGFNQVEETLAQLFPTVTSAFAPPDHAQENQLQIRCLDRLMQEGMLLKHETVRDAMSEVCREATSTDISAPAVIMLNGATPHVRAVTLAGIVKKLVGPDRASDNTFISYFFKPRGMAIHHVISYLTCDLWLQLLGGRHMRLRGEKHDCSIADLCDVVQRAADSTVDPIEKSYLRVVIVLENLSEEEQVQVAEGILSRPRLFPILSCVLSTDQARASCSMRGAVAHRMRMITTHMHTKILPLPTIPDATSADGTEAKRRAAFSSVLDEIDDLLGNNPREMLMCQLITLPGLLEAELRMHLSSASTHVLSPRLDDVFAKLQPFLELYPLLRNGSVMLSQDCCVDVMKRYLIPYMDGFSPKSLKTMAEVVSLRQASPYIDKMLIPTTDADEREQREQGHTVEQVGEYWGSLEMASFAMDRKRYKDWIASEHKTTPSKPRSATVRRHPDSLDVPWEMTLRSSAQTDMLRPDKEISELLRMSQLAFASPTPHLPNDLEDSSSQFDVAPANRPWSAEPRAASRIDDDRDRPRTANSFRYRNDDIFSRGGAPEPGRRRLFQDDRRALSRSVDAGVVAATTHRRPASVERPGSADPWLNGARHSGRSGFEARTLHRFRGVGDVSRSISEATEVAPDLAQTVQPFMKPWSYTTRPQELEKDWIRQDRTMRTRRPRSRTPAKNLVASSKESLASPKYADPESDMDYLAEMLGDAFSLDGGQSRSDGTSTSPDRGIVWSGENILDEDRSGYDADRAAFEEKFLRAVAYEKAARKKTDMVMSHLMKENARRTSEREKKALRLTQFLKHERNPEEKYERRQQLHEKVLAIQKLDRKARHDFREHVRTSYVKWDAIAEAERKEFEKLMKAAVASRPAFDAYEREVEMELRQAQKKKEQEQKAAEPQEVLPDPQEIEAEKQRRQRHEEMLIKRYGMSLSSEQCGAVTQLRDYGVRILREDQPATIMIGNRRRAVRKHRWIRGRTRRDESGSEHRSGDTIQREHFVIQVIPTGKYDSGTESFCGGYRLRVRYSSLQEKVRSVGSQKTITYEGLSRQKPIKVRVKGSDGYQAAWTEQPAEGTNSYTGVVETGPVVPAEFDVRDFVAIEGYFPAARESEEVWVSVRDEIEIEFVRA